MEDIADAAKTRKCAHEQCQCPIPRTAMPTRMNASLIDSRSGD